MTAGPSEDVRVSGELFAPIDNDLELCYQTFGSPSDEPLLLVMGLSGPMTWWDAELCRMLARAGFHVVRFDNRDTGRSSRATGRVTRGMLVRGFTGRRVRTPYTLRDLAGDAFRLMDHLGWSSAHVVGVSMGGMISQTMALTEPRRVRSLTSMSSTTGRRTVGWQDPRLLPLMLQRRAGSREAYIESSRRMWEVIGSPAFGTDDEGLERRAGETWDRGISASGILRQMAAIVTQPDRTPGLRGLAVPTMVIHGNRDKMVHLSGGRATANAVPGAELVVVDGLGHDLPPALYPTFTDRIAAVASRASS